MEYILFALLVPVLTIFSLSLLGERLVKINKERKEISLIPSFPLGILAFCCFLALIYYYLTLNEGCLLHFSSLNLVWGIFIPLFFVSFISTIFCGIYILLLSLIKHIKMEIPEMILFIIPSLISTFVFYLFSLRFIEEFFSLFGIS